MQATIAGKTVADWQASHPLLMPLMALRPLSWFNPRWHRRRKHWPTWA